MSSGYIIFMYGLALGLLFRPTVVGMWHVLSRRRARKAGLSISTERRQMFVKSGDM